MNLNTETKIKSVTCLFLLNDGIQPASGGRVAENFEIKEERMMVWLMTIVMWLTSSGFGMVLLGAILLEICVLIVVFSTKNKDN